MNKRDKAFKGEMMIRAKAMMMVIFLLAQGAVQSALAGDRKQMSQHPSVAAALGCIEQIAPIVHKRNLEGPDVACDLPVTLSEQDLDELFKAALRSIEMSGKNRERAQKYASIVAKTMTNFRAADCTIKLRLKRADILKALASEAVALQFADQPADCDVTTKAHQVEKLRFAFSPRLHMKNGCVSDFALNMGKIDANCRVCYFNRLYMSTKLVSAWANHMSGNVKRVLNIQLGDRCR